MAAIPVVVVGRRSSDHSRVRPGPIDRSYSSALVAALDRRDDYWVIHQPTAFPSVLGPSPAWSQSAHYCLVEKAYARMQPPCARVATADSALNDFVEYQLIASLKT